MSQWTNDDVVHFLGNVAGLKSFADVARQNRIAGTQLARLQRSDLAEFGVKV